MRSKFTEVVMTGEWQKLNLPDFFKFMELENTSTSDVGVKLNDTGAIRVLAPGDKYQLDSDEERDPVRDDVYIMGEDGESIVFEYQIWDFQVEE